MLADDRIGAYPAGMVEGHPGHAEQHQADQADRRGHPVPLMELFQPEGFAFFIHGGVRSFAAEGEMLMRMVMFKYSNLRKECNDRRGWVNSIQ